MATKKKTAPAKTDMAELMELLLADLEELVVDGTNETRLKSCCLLIELVGVEGSDAQQIALAHVRNAW